MLLVGNTKSAVILAEKLGLSCALITHETYPDSETSLQLNVPKSDQEIVVSFQFTTRDSIDAQLLRLISVLNFISPRQVDLIIPYFPYARALPLNQDQPLSAITPLFTQLKNNVRRLYTMDLHCETNFLQENIPSVQIIELSLRQALSDFINSQFEDIVLVAPDKGAAERVQHIADIVKLDNINLTKNRKSATEVQIAGANSISKEHLSKTHLIIDDIISTGGTLFKTISFLQQKGVTDIACLITHNMAKEPTLNQFALRKVPLFTSNSVLGSRQFDIDIIPTIVSALLNDL